MDEVSNGKRTVLVFGDRYKSDGTHQIITLQASKELFAEQQRVSWEVIVVKRRLVWIEPGGYVRRLDLIVAPVLAIGTVNAGCLWGASEGQALHNDSVKFINVMGENSTVSGQALELDAADNNNRMFAHGVNETDIPMANFNCGLHQNQIGTGATTTAAGLHLITAMYTFALLLTTGTYFMRLLLSVKAVLTRCVVVVLTPPDPANLELMKLILDLFYPPPPKDTSTKTQRFLYWALRNEMERLFNGDPFDQYGIIYHHCCEECECRCKNREDTLQKMSRASMRTLLRQRPAPPETKEWTKLGPMVNFMAFGIALSKLLIEVIHHALGSAVNKKGARNDYCERACILRGTRPVARTKR